MKFEGIWGDKWTCRFANEEKLVACQQEWGEALVDLSGVEMAKGMHLARMECDWPPSIAEFIKLARRVELSHASFNIYQRALPRPRNVELGRSTLAECRLVLRG